MTFEPAPAAAFAPREVHSFSSPNDPHDLLPPAAQKKWVALVQRATDAHNAMPEFAIRQEAAETVTVIQNRIAELTRVRSENGWGLSDDAASVIAERAKLKRAVAERDRLQELYEVRSARWNACMRLRRAVGDWLTRGGIPHGTMIEPIEDAPPELKKGETVASAIERHRYRLRELGADLHRVRSSPWPSSLAKAAAKAQIEMLADAAAPDVDRAVEHGLPVSFQTTVTTALVDGTDKPATVSR